MEDDEFLLGVLGLFLGLSITELLSKGADAAHSRHEVPLGWLTPMLSIAIILGMVMTWMNVWVDRRFVVITAPLMIVTTILASSAYVSAALVFPRNLSGLRSLDEHYWRNKRWIMSIQLGVYVLKSTYIATIKGEALRNLSNREWLDLILPVSIVALVVSRWRAVDFVLLLALIVYYVVPSAYILSGLT